MGEVNSSTVLDDDNLVDNNLLEGPPATTWNDLKHARLRRFPGCATDIKWLEYLGHGEEGIVFKASIRDDETPVAIKVFWHTRRPKPHILPGGTPIHFTWPFKRESRTVALIQKIQWAMSEVEQDPKQTVAIKYRPRTRRHAQAMIKAFSEEERYVPRTSTPNSNGLAPFPPFPTCHGWLKLEKSQLPRLHPPVRKKTDDIGWHWAIVYEYVASTTQDPSIAQTFFDFFYAIGFGLEPFRADNWRGGRLVDMNDIRSPFCSAWRPEVVRHYKAAELFLAQDRAEAPTVRHQIIRRNSNSTSSSHILQ
ncbi:hypothetical protein F5X99DRAFT_19540 [Biscogniauxia marginata]|nr:hypothetical protein F5X99DRAFT_19540 [Biscogniauxia marginata]